MIDSTVVPETPTPAKGAVTRDFVPGRNPRGVLSRADWRYLIPPGPYASILYLGRPGEGEASVLDALSPAVTILPDRVPAAVPNGPAQAESTGGLVELFESQIEGRSFDLCVVPIGEMTDDLLSDPGFPDLLERVSRDVRVMLLQYRGWSNRLRGRRLRERVGKEFTRTDVYQCLRRGGNLMIPIKDRGMARYFFKRVLYGVSKRGRLMQGGGRLAATLGITRLLLPERTAVFRRDGVDLCGLSPSPSGSSLSRAADGDSLTVQRVGFHARGDFDSNKVAYYVFEDRAATPHRLIKMTRTSRFNVRLETEYDALRRLEASGCVPAGTYPNAHSLSYTRGLATVGQEVVLGRPFRARTTSRPDCEFFSQGLDWILTLAQNTSRRQGPSSDGYGLTRLLEQFVAFFQPSPDLREYLAQSFSRCCAGNLPEPITVRLHGDAGTWNTIVSDTGRLVFLDWESSRPAGPPLWDLFDFVGSYGAWMARQQGGRGKARNYVHGMFEFPSYTERVAKAVTTYCETVGVPADLVEPLFLSRWVERAVREAEWTSGPLREAGYFDLVGRLVDHRLDGGSLEVIWS